MKKQLRNLRTLKVSSNGGLTFPQIRKQKSPHNKEQKVFKGKHYIYNYESEEEEGAVPVPPKFPGSKTFTTLEPIVSLPLYNNINLPRTQDSQSSSKPKSNYPKTPEDDASLDRNRCHCDKFINVKTIRSEVQLLTKSDQTKKLTEFQTLDNTLLFKTYDALSDFNKKFEDVDYFSNMETSISLLGGKDAQDTTRKILSLIVSHELILKMNWTGVNNKSSFQKLDKVLKLIYGAVRRNPMCVGSTNAEIDALIKNWIKNAPDREGGRASRKKDKARVPPEEAH